MSRRAASFNRDLGLVVTLLRVARLGLDEARSGLAAGAPMDDTVNAVAIPIEIRRTAIVKNRSVP